VTNAVKKTTLPHVITSRQLTKPGSPEKRPRHRDELEQQADTFGRDWRAGDRVMTWLNRHEGRAGELSRLVEDGWSWADIGRAMHLAGIAYRTGEPISAAILRKKASEARAIARAKNAPPLGALPNTDAPVSSPAETDVPTGDEEPEFRPATLRGWSGTKIVRGEKKPVEAKAPDAHAPTNDAGDVIARLLGRK
jgi:hypothetical protein